MSNQLMIDVDGNRMITPEAARREALAARQREIEIARMEAQWLAERGARAAGNAEFWQHAAIFYDRFFGVITPSYGFTVAAMEFFGYITPADRQLLVANTPRAQRAAIAGTVLGIAVSFWLPTRVSGGGNAFRVGTRAHFWTGNANFSTRMADATRISQQYGLLNVYVRIPRVIERTITVTNNNVFGVCKFIVGQMATQVRGAVERSQDERQRRQGGGR
jgi:hypothetical protein